MNVFDMTKEDFKKVPERGGWSRDIGEFNALVIIPQDYAHDSGWMCMDFVAVSKDGEPICRLSGCSDVLYLDGIGGYGNWRPGELPNLIEPKGWSIDCLHCVLVRHSEVHNIPGNNRIYADGRTGADSNYQNGNILLYGCKGNLRWRS